MRLENKCCGDCSSCELLKNEKVEMVPCILDQLFQKQKRVEKNMEELKELILSINTNVMPKVTNLASDQNYDVQENADGC